MTVALLALRNWCLRRSLLIRPPFVGRAAHESLGNSAVPVTTTATNIRRVTRARREDVAQGQSRVHQTGLHGWCPGFVPEPQRPVRSDEVVVVATYELDVATELVCATGVAGRAPTQVRRRLPNREVEALDERGVQGLGILRLPQRGLESTRPADLHAALDTDDTIVSPRLEHLAIDARWPNEVPNRPEVVLEAIGGDQGTSNYSPPADDVVNHGPGVLIGAAAQDAPGPQAGRYLDGREQPDGLVLVANERAELISLQLNEPRNRVPSGR